MRARKLVLGSQSRDTHRRKAQHSTSTAAAPAQHQHSNTHAATEQAALQPAALQLLCWVASAPRLQVQNSAQVIQQTTNSCMPMRRTCCVQTAQNLGPTCIQQAGQGGKGVQKGLGRSQNPASTPTEYLTAQNPSHRRTVDGGMHSTAQHSTVTAFRLPYFLPDNWLLLRLQPALKRLSVATSISRRQTL